MKLKRYEGKSVILAQEEREKRSFSSAVTMQWCFAQAVFVCSVFRIVLWKEIAHLSMWLDGVIDNAVGAVQIKQRRRATSIQRNSWNSSRGFFFTLFFNEQTIFSRCASSNLR